VTTAAQAAPSPPSRTGRPPRWFPGDRRVWVAAGAVLLVLAAVATVELLRPRGVYTGTNSISTRGVAVEVPDDRRFCVNGLAVPGGTGMVYLDFMGPAAQPRIDGELYVGDRLARTTLPAGPAGQHALGFAVPEVPGDGAHAGRFCLTPRGGPVALGGMLGLQHDQVAPTLAGLDVPTRVGVWFRPPLGERRTLLSLLPDIAHRAALFRPGWVGPWTYWAVMLLLTPLLCYASVRLLARSLAGERPRVPAAVAVGLVALVNGAVFATFIPAFQTPDEPDHVAYVQILGETGHRPSGDAARGAFSQEEVVALDAVRAFSTVERFDGRPPWREADLDRWRTTASEPLGRDEGGGASTAASHRPGYYLAAAPAYLAARDSGFFASMWAMRLVSALFGAITAACTVLFIRELAPRASLGAAVLGGLLVACLPQFAFMSGAVNNDAGITAISAVALWLTARAVRRGLPWPTMVALGAVAALVVLFKQTGIALYPAIFVAIALAAVFMRDRRALLGLGAGVAGFAVGRLIIMLVDQLVTPVPVEGATGSGLIAAGGVVRTVLDRPTLVLSYLWQTFLPPLPFMTDLFTGSSLPVMDTYVREGFASFGWYTMEFAPWVYRGIAVALLALGASALAAGWRYRGWLGRNLPQLALVVLSIAGVIGGVTAAYVSASPRSGELPEQGRYAFTALPALAAVAVAAVYGLPRRWRPVVAGGVLAALLALLWASQMMLLQRFYT
jgi:hypothetical protein